MRSKRGLGWGRVGAATVALALAAAPALCDERDEQIDALRHQLSEFREEQQRMRAQIEDLQREADARPTDLEAAVADVVAGMDSGSYEGPAGVRRPTASIDVGGYFSTRYVSSQLPGKKSSFVDMRLVPQIHANISRNIEFDSEIEIEHAGVGGPAEDGEIIVEYAELSFEFDPRFTLKAGTLLIPFGQFNLNHDDPMNELSERPRVARFVVPSAFDLPGIGAEGVFETDSGVLSYDVALTNGFRDEFDSEKGARSARGLFEEDDNHDKTVFGRLAFVPIESPIDAVSVGVSGALGRLGDTGRGRDRLRGWGIDAQAKHGPWEAMFEYDSFTIDRAGGTPSPVLPSGDLGPVRGLSGYYAQLLYRLDAPWLSSLPIAEDNATMAFVVRYDSVDLNDRVRGASPQDDETAWTVGINYRPTAKTVIKIEYRFADSPFDGPEGSDRDFFALEFATYF
jgi:hypothetical protein